MKILNPSLAFIFVAAIILITCNKEETPPINQAEMWDCHHKTEWDSLKTKERLIGTWDWEYIGCYWNTEDANDDSFKGMTIEFKSDSTLIVRENGQMTQTSRWVVVDEDADLYSIEVDPTVIQLYGRILFCEKIVEFNDSYIDGCDNYFKRND